MKFLIIFRLYRKITRLPTLCHSAEEGSLNVIQWLVESKGEENTEGNK